MTEDNKRENVRLLLAEAEQAQKDARLLFDACSYKGAVSRAYYAALNHARALLLSEGIEVKTHGGVQHMIYQTFVRTGRLEPAMARVLQQLEGDRLQADYEAAAIYTADVTADSLEASERYGEAIRRALSAAGYL